MCLEFFIVEIILILVEIDLKFGIINKKDVDMLRKTRIKVIYGIVIKNNYYNF